MPIDMHTLIQRLREARKDEEEQQQRRGPQEVVISGTAGGDEAEEAEEDETEPGGGALPVRNVGPEGDEVPAPEPEQEEPVLADQDHVSLETGAGGDGGLWWEEEGMTEGVGQESEEESTDVDLKYPLIPKDPDEGEQVYAWAHIRYHEDKEEVIYEVHEPELSPENEELLSEVEDRLKETIDVDFGDMKREEAREFLQRRISEILRGREFNIDPEAREVIQYYAYRNFVGLGKIEPLMNDKYIEDISCDGTGIPVYVYHRNPDVASVETDVVFEDDEDLDSFVRKLAQRCGRSVSMAEPLVDGSLPDGSRVQATLATDIARRGSNFTIRKFTEDPLTPIDIMNFGTINAEMLAYFWLAIENGKSILIAGPTAAGKTSL
ncbi:MAG: type II/IV secretion system ATPase subunit, partial [Candidatus Nanohaloarchaea archaeon]